MVRLAFGQNILVNFIILNRLSLVIKQGNHLLFLNVQKRGKANSCGIVYCLQFTSEVTEQVIIRLQLFFF